LPRLPGFDHRILREIAEPIGRAPTIGRPWLWRLKDEHRK
jgi:hypothetical protein